MALNAGGWENAVGKKSTVGWENAVGWVITIKCKIAVGWNPTASRKKPAERVWR
jgi:hypothetical protein